MLKKLIKIIKYDYFECVLAPFMWFATILLIITIAYGVYTGFVPFNYFNAGAEDYVKSKLGIEIKLKGTPIWENNLNTTLLIPEQYMDRKSEILQAIKEYGEIYNHRIITTRERVKATIVKLVERNRHGYLGRFETRKYEIEYNGLKSYYVNEARSEILANAGGDRPLEPGEKVWTILVTEKYNDTGEIVSQYLR